VITEAAVLDALADRSWDDGEQQYIRYHLRRFVFLLKLVDELLDRTRAAAGAPARYLDVGPHFMTRLVDRFFGARVRIDTLGWENPRMYDTGRIGRHFEFDLNDAYDPTRWPDAIEHDVVLMAEVIEHLYTAPEQVLAFMRRYVRPGGFLVVGTPNAVSIQHRVQMVLGRHPYERIRLDRGNPGHFKEYTAEELVESAQQAGFELTSVSYSDYLAGSKGLGLRAMIMVVPSLRPYMTLVLKREMTEGGREQRRRSRMPAELDARAEVHDVTAKVTIELINSAKPVPNVERAVGSVKLTAHDVLHVQAKVGAPGQENYVRLTFPSHVPRQLDAHRALSGVALELDHRARARADSKPRAEKLAFVRVSLPPLMVHVRRARAGSSLPSHRRPPEVNQLSANDEHLPSLSNPRFLEAKPVRRRVIGFLQQITKVAVVILAPVLAVQLEPGSRQHPTPKERRELVLTIPFALIW
jgi:hypothetical protein